MSPMFARAFIASEAIWKLQGAAVAEGVLACE